jgi:hypothetical protein
MALRRRASHREYSLGGYRQQRMDQMEEGFHEYQHNNESTSLQPIPPLFLSEQATERGRGERSRKEKVCPHINSFNCTNKANGEAIIETKEVNISNS